MPQSTKPLFYEVEQINTCTYPSALSCNRRYSVSNWLDYKVITTA